MIHVHLDIETRSRRDLPSVGARKYFLCPAFKIIWLSFAIDDGEVITLDMYNEPYPGYMLQKFAPHILEMLKSKEVGRLLFWAWNAPFEILGLMQYLGIEVEMQNWRCAMVLAGYLGLPRALGDAAKVLHLDTLKDSEGTKLISLFSKPQTTRKQKYSFAEFVLPEWEPEKWANYGRYNNQDVVVERAVVKHLSQYPGPSDTEWLYWRQNEEVNARGMFIDVPFVNACIDVCARYLQGITTQIEALTGLTNQSDQQIKAWIEARGIHMPSLAKDYLIDNVNPDLLPPEVNKLIELRGAKSKTSISKYQTALDFLCPDGRIHDQIQHYGADTGRFAGRGFQPHNVPKTFSYENLIKRNAKRLGVPEAAIKELVGDALQVAKDAILSRAGELFYTDVTAVVGKMQRTAIVAEEGKMLVPCDYSSIEARMLAWVAGEEWQLEVFRTHGKIYEATAAQMYNKALEDVTGEEREKGKRATLALGYQGWTGAMITSGALRAGMTEDELPGVCKAWRTANPAIAASAKIWKYGRAMDNPSPGLWAKLEHCARYVILTQQSYTLQLPYCSIGFSFERGNMFITLPSGRRLCYHGAHCVGDVIRYMGMKTIPGTTKRIWGSIDLYGGLITENIIQAMARDCLVWVMDLMHRDGLPIVLHVHDEVVPEVPGHLAEQTLVYMEHLMSQTPLWAKGLPLKAKGFITHFYCKDS
jgi:DNA polymerase